MAEAELDRGETPSMADVIQDAMKGLLKDTHTSMPGRVISYDRTKQLAQIQPSLKRRYKDGRVINLPIIQNVPVLFQGNGAVRTHFDLVPGDYVLLLFSERSIDKWQVSGGEVLPGDRRMHHLSDAICIPGIRPNSETEIPKGNPGSYVVSNGENYFEVKADGKFVVKNSSNELMAVIVELLQEMITETEKHIAGKNLTAIGPLEKEPIYITQLEDTKAKYEALKERFETFKE